jgi:hypothetical protein
VKLVFLLGQTKYNQTQIRINDESEHYNDVIQEQFLDTYNNLTLKAVMMLKWVKNNCVKKGQKGDGEKRSLYVPSSLILILAITINFSSIFNEM